MKVRSLVMTIGLVAMHTAAPTMAQDAGTIIVTAQRSDRSDFNEYYDDDQSAIGLTRRADYFVKPLYVSSDSRDSGMRKDELRAMLRETIQLAPDAGINLVAGNYTLKPVTLSDVEELDIQRGTRPDTSRVKIYARIDVTRNSKGIKEADERISKFVKSIPVTGRSFIDMGSTGLAINNPDQYRGAVVKVIADEVKRYSAMFGSDYGVEIRGLDSELYWQQASETEVFLYLEHSFIIKPK